MPFTAGVARRVITPPWGVELAGLGYYLQRTWQRVRDDLTATALVVGDENGHAAAVVACDLMYNDRKFTRSIREQVAANTDIPAESVCVNFSHSHNAPTAGFICGAGVQDAEYVRFVAREVATAVIMAWRGRQPAAALCRLGGVARHHRKPHTRKWSGGHAGQRSSRRCAERPSLSAGGELSRSSVCAHGDGLPRRIAGCSG